MNNNGYTLHQDKKSVIEASNGQTIASVVYTDPLFAKRIIDYFSPQFQENDTFLDPCRGKGAFFDHLPDKKDYCELQEGKDFFDYDQKVSWVITNAPWKGSVYAAFTAHAFQLAENVVYLVKLFGALGTDRRLRDARNNSMFLKEIITVPWKLANFTFADGSKKASEGFTLAVIHWQKNYQQGTRWNQWL